MSDHILAIDLAARLASKLTGGGSREPTPRAFFVDPPYFEGTTDSTVTVRFRNMTIGLSWAFSIASSGGGTDVTDSGTVSAEEFDIVADCSGLGVGILTLTSEQDGVPFAEDSAQLLAPFEYATFDSDIIKFDSTDYTFDGAAP